MRRNNNNASKKCRKFTIPSNSCNKCQIRSIKKNNCYCKNPPVPARIRIRMELCRCHNAINEGGTCMFPDMVEDDNCLYKPIESISIYTNNMLLKARELLTYDPCSAFLRKLKAKASKAVLPENHNKCDLKFSETRDVYEDYVARRNKADSILRLCKCAIPDTVSECDEKETETCMSKTLDVDIQTSCTEVEKKTCGTETVKCCPKCCKCHKLICTGVNTDCEPEPVKEDSPTTEVQSDEPKATPCKPKIGEGAKVKTTENSDVEEAAKKCSPKTKNAPTKKTKQKKLKISSNNTLLGPEQRTKKPVIRSKPCYANPCLPECYPQQFPNNECVKDLQLFRNDYFFETRSTQDCSNNSQKHECIHHIGLNENFQPYSINPDPYGYSRCYTCNAAMTTVQNLATKLSDKEKIDLYRKSKMSSLTMKKFNPVCIESTKIQIPGKHQKVMVKLPPYRENVENVIKSKYKRPMPINSLALRFQKGVRN